MMIQIHNERSNVIGLDRSLELNWRWWGWIKNEEWEKLQRGVGKACFSISHDHAKFSHSHAKWNRVGLAAAHKGNVKSDFAWPCEIFAQSCETLQQDENAVDGFSTSHHHAKLLGARAKMYFLQIPWWRSLQKTS